MTTPDFEAIMRQAVDSGKVSKPIPADFSDADIQSMRLFEQQIVDLIDQHNLPDGNVAVVLITMIGQAIVAMTNSATDALNLYIRVCSSMLDIVTVLIEEKKKDK
jgi:hypothetical protein